MFERQCLAVPPEAAPGCPTSFDLHIVGSGPYLETLKSQAASLGVRAKFYGYLDNDSAELRNRYRDRVAFRVHVRVGELPHRAGRSDGGGRRDRDHVGHRMREVVWRYCVDRSAADAEALQATL